MARRPHFFVSGEVSHEIVRGTTTGDHGSFQAALIERGADCSRGTQDLSDYLCGVGIRGGWSCDGKPSQPVCLYCLASTRFEATRPAILIVAKHLYGGRAIGWGGASQLGWDVSSMSTLLLQFAERPSQGQSWHGRWDGVTRSVLN